MTEQHIEIFKNLPAREKFILAGLVDDTYQPTDMNKVLETKKRADALSDKYNKLVASEKVRAPYFDTIQTAGEDSITFLTENGATLEGIQRAKQWLGQYNPIDTSGFDVLMQEFTDECGTNNQKADANQILSSLNMTKEQLIAFKNAYVANIMTQLVGGLIREKDDKVSVINSTGEASIVIGLPGSGKSTTIKDIKVATRAFHIDADAIKGVVAKTFGVSINAVGMHQLSSYIRNELVAYAQREKVNLIIEKIGETPGPIRKTGKALAENGYDVGLSLVHVKNSRSQSNNMARAIFACEKFEEQVKNGSSVNNMEPPRMVMPHSIEEFGDGPLFTYLSLMSDRENGPFKVFSASCNETIFLKERTAPPIKLYGISDENAPGFVGKQRVLQGFQQLGKSVKSISYEYFTQMIQTSDSPDAVKKIELEQITALAKGENGIEIANLSEELKNKLLSSKMMFVAMVNALMYEVYNPENATITNDIRTSLEEHGNESKIRETLANMIAGESVQKKMQQLFNEQVNEIKQKTNNINGDIPDGDVMDGM